MAQRILYIFLLAATGGVAQSAGPELLGAHGHFGAGEKGALAPAGQSSPGIGILGWGVR